MNQSRTGYSLFFAFLILNGPLACDDDEPKGPKRAGVITSKNQEKVLLPGDAAIGQAGDYYLQNELATFIIQKPGRNLALGPYGGTLVDVALNGKQDHFGELIPAIALGRTVRIDELWVKNSGSNGKAAVIEGRGKDARNIYYNLEGIEPGLLSYIDGGGGLLAHDPNGPMGLEVFVRYTLEPDEARLNILYRFETSTTVGVEVPFGLLVDTRGNVENFLAGLGFQSNIEKRISGEILSALIEVDQDTNQAVLVAEDGAVAIVPRRINENTNLRVLGIQIPTLGTGLLFEAENALSALSESSFNVYWDEPVEVEIDIFATPSLQTALESSWGVLGEATASVSGCVTNSLGQPEPHLRVGFYREENEAVATLETDDTGCFSGTIPPGDYETVAGKLYRPLSDRKPVTVPGEVNLTIPALGELAVTVDIVNSLETTTVTPLPCRVTVIGERTTVSEATIGDDPFDDPGGVIHRLRYLRTCNDTLRLTPGSYLIYVTRGPEFERIEKVVEIRAGEKTNLSGTIRRAVNSADYAASDFHVHAIGSPDSSVPRIERTLSMAAEGLDFWASTDHDVVEDYTPIIQSLGLSDHLSSVPGAEITTFDTGHFGAFPLPMDPNQANGGTPDWAVSDAGIRPTMETLFQGVRDDGALVQINHPRGGGTAMAAYFSRAGLAYDPVTKEPFADPNLQRIANEYIHYDPDIIYFSDHFDIIEVMNGANTYVHNEMVYENSVEHVGHDWMNLLSAGRKIVAVANSDTHQLYGAGSPRTMVAGHDGGPQQLMNELARGNAILTTGPMVVVRLRDESGTTAGLGDTLKPSSSIVTLEIGVETPDWYQVDKAEIISNVFFPDPTVNERAGRVGELISLDPIEVVRPNGAIARVATAEVTLDLSEAPFHGKDSWIVVRVGGTSGNLYPVMHRGGGTLNLEATSPEAFLSERSGIKPFAMTNAIYVDTDGDDSWKP